MKTKDDFNFNQSSLEQHFRQLRKSVLKEYKAEHKLRQELAFQPDIERVEERAAKFEEIFEHAGISLKLLREMDEYERVEVDRHIKRMRKKLRKRKPDLEHDARENIMRSSYYNKLGAVSLPLIGARDRIRPKPTAATPQPA